MCFNNTLFHSPLRPITVVSLPGGIVKSIPCNTRWPPNVFSTPISLIISVSRQQPAFSLQLRLFRKLTADR